MIVDAHLHLWDLSVTDYPFLSPENRVLYRTFQPPEAASEFTGVGVQRVVLVQAMNSPEDTAHMLDIAKHYDWVGAVVGWVPLDHPDEAEKTLAAFRRYIPILKGVRHLVQHERNPDWLVQDRVIKGLRALASFGMTYDVVAVFPNHLKHVPVLAERVPDLRMVIDHLAKPPREAKAYAVWKEQMRAAAESPRVFAKISGLGTATADFRRWGAKDIQPWIDDALEIFGAERLMFGSDWPVALQAGTYAKVWEEVNIALAERTPEELAAIFGGTAVRFYGVE